MNYAVIPVALAGRISAGSQSITVQDSLAWCGDSSRGCRPDRFLPDPGGMGKLQTAIDLDQTPMRSGDELDRFLNQAVAS